MLAIKDTIVSKSKGAGPAALELSAQEGHQRVHNHKHTQLPTLALISGAEGLREEQEAAGWVIPNSQGRPL